MDVTLELGTSGGGIVDKLKEVKEQLAQNLKASEDFNKAEQESAKASIAAADDWIKKQKEMLELQAQQTAQIKAQQTAIKELRAKYEELQSSSSGSLDAKAVKDYNDQIKALKKEIADLKAQIEGSGGKGKLKIFAEGSREEAIATVKRIKAELDTLNTTQLKSSYGKQLVSELKLAEKELDNLTSLAGQSAEKTGNVFKKAWGFLRQAAYIIPGVGIAGIIGAISEGIITLASKMFSFGESMKKVDDIISESSGKYQQAVTNVTSLRTEIEAAKNGFISKEGVVKQYNETLGKTIGLAKNLDEVEKLLNENAEAYIKYTFLKAVANQALEESAKAAFEAEKIRQKQLLDFVTVSNELSTGLQSGFGQSPAQAAADAQLAQQNRLKSAQKEKDEQVKLEQDKVNSYKTIYDKFFKEASQIAKDRGWNFFDDTKEGKAKALKDFKDRSDQIIALEKQIAQIQLQALQDGREKEIAIENAKYDDIIKVGTNKERQYQEEINKIRNAKDISPENKKKEIDQLTQLAQLESEMIEQERISHNARLLAIDIKYFQDAEKAYKESKDSVNDLVLKDQEKELSSLAEKYEKAFKQIENARTKALQVLKNPVAISAANVFFDDQTNKLTEQQENDRLLIVQKYAIKRLDTEEDLEKAKARIIKVAGANQEQLEKLRQIAVLKVQIDFAKKKIEVLKQYDSEDNQKEIAKLQDQISGFIAIIDKADADLDKRARNKKTDIWDLLGFKLSDKEKRDAETALQSLTDSLLSIWGSYIQKRIDQSEELLNQLQTEIEKQQDKVDKEKELKDKGLANDLEIEQSRLDDLKRRNNEQIAELKKAQKEQESFAKAQQIIQGTVAAAKLGVAAASYFATGAETGGNPLIGVALALAAIATMVATFASLKSETKQLTNFQTYRQGGEYDATTGNHATHEQGGIDVVDSRNGAKLAEFERNEYAYFFRDGEFAKKFKPLFDEINKGHLSKWHVSPEGLQFPDSAFQTIIVGGSSGTSSVKSEQYLSEINSNVRKMIEPKTETEIVDGYKIEKTGNHIRKIKL